MAQNKSIPVKDLTKPQFLKLAASALKNRRFDDFSKLMGNANKDFLSDPLVRHFQGLFHFEMKSPQKARSLIEGALKERPHDPMIKHNLSAVLIGLGEFDKAQTLLQQALETKPDYAEAYHTLAPIYTFTADDPLIAQMEKALQNDETSEVDRSFLNFALAKAKDDVRDIEGAWQALQSGNAATKTSYDPEAEREGVAALKACCTAPMLEALGKAGHPTPAPVFVVGMPRSGTTLLEAIISEHPQVHAAGELPAIENLAREMARRMGIERDLPGHAELLERGAQEHFYGAALGYLDTVRKGADRWFDQFVDKLPDNSFNLGLIAALLPNARVIHIMRHPLDTMLSIYFQRFTSIQYAFDPNHIVAHYKNYRDLMAFWQAHLPQPPLEIRYESLVQDRQAAQDFLWRHLGLRKPAGDGTTLRESGLQNTASRWQVRQPVYQSSREKFRRYEKWLAPFIEAMGGMAAIEAEVAEQKERCQLYPLLQDTELKDS